MALVRTLIRRILRAANCDIRRYVTESGAVAPMLDLAVAAYVAELGNPYFVQVGANDGVIDDPLRQLILKYHLPGLLMEPMPDVFAELLKNYAGETQLAFENCALWHEDGECEFFRVKPTAYPNPRVKGMAGMSREVLLGSSRHLPGLARNLETSRVQTVSPKSLFEKHAVSQIDLLLVDAEGFDDQIIKIILEYGARPAIIHYEHLHLSPDRQDASAHFLSEKGYRFARTRISTLALLDQEPFGRR